MLDIKKVRENPDHIDKILAKRNHPAISKDLLSADEKNRSLISELQKIQEERNTKSKLIGEYAAKGSVEDADKLKEAGVKSEYKCFEGTIHGFTLFPAALTSAQEGLDLIADYIKKEL